MQVCEIHEGIGSNDRSLCCGQVGVHMPDDPSLMAWKGASAFAISPEYSHLAVTKAQYEEYGCENLVGVAANGGAPKASSQY